VDSTFQNQNPLKMIIIVSILTFSSLVLSGCDWDPFGLHDPIDDAVEVLEEAIETLENESANWQSVLEETRDELIDEGQATIRNEVSNVLTRAIAATGTELRCNFDFARDRVRQDLIRIKANLLNQAPPEIVPAICNVVPIAIDASLVPDNLPYLEFYGYDFDSGVFQVLLVEGNSLLDVTHHLSMPTHYHMTLNLGINGVQISSESSQVILKWDGVTYSSITISQPQPEDPALPACVWTNYVSEETSSALCPSGYALKGLNCSGSYCDNKELYCCPYHHTNDTESSTQYSSWFTDGDNNSYITNSKFISGLRCRGNYCDDISLRILQTPKLSNIGQCFFMPRISEEGSAESICPEGFFGAGMSCSGDYCDNVSLRCCRYE